MRRVYMLSPYAAIDAVYDADQDGVLVSPAYTVESNKEFARRCMLNCFARGEAPFAPHLLYTQVLDDQIPADRVTGMKAGIEWMLAADMLVVYCDRGISKGMRTELVEAVKQALFFQAADAAQRGAEYDRLPPTRTDFRRLDGRSPPSWFGLHEQNIPHLADEQGRQCPICTTD